MNIITNYDQIIIKPNHLIVLDIDETTLKYPMINDKWWKYNNETFGNDYAYNLWLDIVNSNYPKILDSQKFFDFIDKAEQFNCKIVFLTARYIELKQITLDHLRACNIKVDDNDVYFNSEKGKEILKIIKNYNYNNYIFVDDVKKNIDNVLNSVDNIDVYLMEHDNLYI